MSEEAAGPGIEFNISVDNLDEVKRKLESFGRRLHEGLYNSFTRMAGKEEQLLKGVTAFNDRSGRSRRSLFVVPTWNPPGLEAGSYLPHMVYLAYGHGTWRGGWWDEFIEGFSARVQTRLEQAIHRIVTTFNREAV